MAWYHRLAESRPPDLVLGPPDNPVRLRWHVIRRNPFFGIYLHHSFRSDDDRALHDHPYLNISYILEGDYTEHTILPGGVNKRVNYREGQFLFRRAKTAHRLEVDKPCWSLFITGPRIRNWGFHCTHGWRPWQEYTKTTEYGPTYGEIGKGCDD